MSGRVRFSRIAEIERIERHFARLAHRIAPVGVIIRRQRAGVWGPFVVHLFDFAGAAIIEHPAKNLDEGKRIIREHAEKGSQS